MYSPKTKSPRLEVSEITPTKMTKSELRKSYLAKRVELSPSEAALMSSAIAERFFAEIDLEKVRALHTFIRIRKFNEVDTSVIYYRLWRDHPEIQTVAPALDPSDGELKNIAFSAASEFEENTWGIREPVGQERIEPAKIDLVVVPLLCFDLRGFRVGYGKGFYDRFLAKCRPDCKKVGLSFFPPVERIDDVYEGDVALDCCVTAEGLYTF